MGEAEQPQPQFHHSAGLKPVLCTYSYLKGQDEMSYQAKGDSLYIVRLYRKLVLCKVSSDRTAKYVFGAGWSIAGVYIEGGIQDFASLLAFKPAHSQKKHECTNRLCQSLLH